MGERHIHSLDGLEKDEVGGKDAGDGGGPNIGPATPKPAATPMPVGAVSEAMVEVNYPDATLLSVVIRDVAKWSGQCFVMEPSQNVKIQIFAPRRLPRTQAYELFLASLSVVNLRAVQVGQVVKIVPSGLPMGA
jgi:type II secretory pathway component GspD/PulD (secretin)